jgi:flagellar biogenesis protein FliO
VLAERSSRKGFRVPRPPVAAAEAEAQGENYALRLTEALEAISAAQPESPPPPPTRKRSFNQIPWGVALPALVGLVVLVGVIGRSSAQADVPGVQLPAQQTYPVQSEAPLFTNSQQTSPAATPLGAPESSPPAFDLFDISFKLVAVLALAYASLMLLKRAGFGGARVARSGGASQAMRVVSSLALAPNRSVHIIKVSGGRALLVGATPSVVNLIADLGELAETDVPEEASFFDVLKAKIS